MQHFRARTCAITQFARLESVVLDGSFLRFHTASTLSGSKKRREGVVRTESESGRRTFRITCWRKRAKAAVAGQVHAVVGRRAAQRPYGNYCQSDQLQEPTFARSGVGAHGAAAEVLLQHDVAPLSRDDPSAIIWLAAIRPALMNSSSGIVS